MKTLLPFLSVATFGALVAVIVRRVWGAQGARAFGIVANLAGAAGMIWAWFDARGKEGWDAVAPMLLLLAIPACLAGYWIGVLLMSRRARSTNGPGGPGRPGARNETNERE